MKLYFPIIFFRNVCLNQLKCVETHFSPKLKSALIGLTASPEFLFFWVLLDDMEDDSVMSGGKVRKFKDFIQTDSSWR